LRSSISASFPCLYQRFSDVSRFDRILNAPVFLEIHQPLDIVLFGVAIDETLTVLIHPPKKVVRDANIGASTPHIREDADVPSHTPSSKVQSPRVKPEGDDRV
jgi:hypothetical protein